MKIRIHENRIALIGLSASGKTVFLTSLINHLKDHDPALFPLGKDEKAIIRRFRELEPDQGWSRFEYERQRSKLMEKQAWPGKTKDRNQYACEFERSDWRFSKAKLKSFDMPGERLADAVMLGTDYSGWSEHILRMIESDPDCRESGRAFQELLESPKVEARELITAYKCFLVKLILQHKPYVSPSTFLVSPDGKVNKARPAEEMVAAPFFIGKDKEREFVPLPEPYRVKRPDIVEPFAQRYQAYRNEIVLPLIRGLRSCHAFVVLVDVGMLLAGGVGMYNDNRKMLADLLDVLQPGQSLLGQILRYPTALLPHGWRPSRTTRIAVVAPKQDLVHDKDRDNMESLLRRMIENRLRNLDGVEYEFFNCSAIVSAEPVPLADGQRWMKAFPIYDSQTGQKVTGRDSFTFKVSELPHEWPNTWRPGDFSFPDVYPPMPHRHDCPPEQVNLNKILDFIMGVTHARQR